MRFGLVLVLVLGACGDDSAPMDASTFDAGDVGATDGGSDAPPTDAGVDAPTLMTFDGAEAVAVGQAHACARRTDGTVWCWGGNQAGQLGDGTYTSRSEPQPVVELGPTTHLTAGGYHTCVLTEDATRACWGFNLFGQITRGTTDQTMPVLRGVDRRDVSAGERHTCEITPRNTVSCVGDNSSGQLGSGTTVSDDRGVQVRGVRDPVQVSAGDSFTCAVVEGGQLWCWGFNGVGQLGTGDQLNALEPAESLIDDVTQVATGASHACAVRSDATLWCWGQNRHGELGRGNVGGQFPTPEAVPELTDVVEVATGAEHTCARTSSGSVVCWGRGREGQLGSGETTARVPMPMDTGITDAVAIAAGRHTSCAVRGESGEVWCWGGNSHGQVDADREERTAPGPIQLPVL